MNVSYIIHELDRNVAVFDSLLSNIDKQMYLWKPAPEKWCMLEIVCHLYDEEREDFRARVAHTLENPQQLMKPIDPVGWVTDRKYIGQDYNLMVEKFLSERRQSIQWVSKLNNAKWNNIYKHPKLGAFTAYEFLSNWLAHDYLHVRQIVRTKFLYLENISGEDLSYAGPW